jgi:hypothetical protein
MARRRRNTSASSAAKSSTPPSSIPADPPALPPSAPAPLESTPTEQPLEASTPGPPQRKLKYTREEWDQELTDKELGRKTSPEEREAWRKARKAQDDRIAEARRFLDTYEGDAAKAQARILAEALAKMQAEPQVTTLAKALAEAQAPAGQPPTTKKHAGGHPVRFNWSTIDPMIDAELERGTENVAAVVLALLKQRNANTNIAAILIPSQSRLQARVRERREARKRGN